MLKRRKREADAPAPKAATPKDRVKRNLPAEERRRELLDAALDIFAEKGLSITIQELADRVNVTQPLVHRYFKTKADLIAGIRDKIQNAHWDPAWKTILTDRSRPLFDRIRDFYDLYLPHIYSAGWYRGFWYAALADPSFAQAYLAHVTEELLISMIGETRFEFGFPDLASVPASSARSNSYGACIRRIFSSACGATSIRRRCRRTPGRPCSISCAPISASRRT